MDTIRPTRRFPFVCAALAALALTATATVQAQSSSATEPHHLKVRYGDLDLATISGASTLYGRIQGAARFVCGQEGRSLLAQQQYRACIRQAVSDAVATVDNPNLSALYEGRAPRLQTASLRQ